MNQITSAKNTLHNIYTGVAAAFMPDEVASAFNEKGVLTPDEFLAAGNQLVYKCPTWSWDGGDRDKNWSFLPPAQQFLITRGVPCLRRVSGLESDQKEETVEDGEWLSTYTENDDMNQLNDAVKNLAIDDLDEIGEITPDNNDRVNIDSQASNDEMNTVKLNQPLINLVEHSALNPTNFEVESDSDDGFEHIPDIESFNDDDNLLLPSAIKNNNLQSDDEENNREVINLSDSDDATQNKSYIVRHEDESKTIRTRTYDIHITYDKYYRVPRVWLRGYDERQNPLTSSQVMEDISADHAHKTVTVEAHPHTGVVCASIHPCQHSHVMKIFIDKMEESDKHMTVDQYMFLFLKFMSAVIPTIEYDYTVGIDG